MKALLRQMVKENLAILVLALVSIYFFYFLENRSLIDDSGVAIWISNGILLFLAVLKPFCVKNSAWSRWLPLKKWQMLTLAAAEFSCFTVYAFISTTFFISLNSRIEVASVFSTKLLKGFSQIYLSYFTFTNIVSAIAILTLASPLVFAHFRTFGPESKSSADRSLALGFLKVSMYFIALYFAPLLSMTIGLTTLSMTAANSTLKGSRQYQKLRQFYIASIAISGLLTIGFATEVWPAPIERPLARLNFYGSFAPSPSREWVMAKMNNPEMEDKTLSELSAYGKKSFNLRNLIQTNELKFWSDQATDSKVFFHGLSIFENEIWSKTDLDLLDGELSKRCTTDGRPQLSEFGSHFLCDTFFQTESRTRIRIADLKTVEGISAETNPYLTLLTLELLLRTGLPENWKARVTEFTHSQNKVIANYAQFILHRRKLNSSNEWNCDTNRESKNKSNCEQARLTRFTPISFKTKNLDDTPGSLSLWTPKPTPSPTPPPQ